MLAARYAWQLLNIPSRLSNLGPLSNLAILRHYELEAVFGFSRKIVSSTLAFTSASENQHHASWTVPREPPIPRGFCKRAVVPYTTKEEDISGFKDWAEDQLVKERPASLSPLPLPVAGERRSEVSSVAQGIYVPREVVWLNGAPGAGKGVNTSHIMKTRGLETSLCLSDLLSTHPDSREIINRGDMLPDTMVGDLLLEALLVNSCNAPECGVLVDGFPRTTLQVDFLKMLSDKLSDLHTLCANTQLAVQFPRSLFKVVMLYVDEETSITRQMARAEQASKHNKRIIDAGAGDLRLQRSTDMSIIKCRKRYSIFKAHYMATLRLKQFFPFHLIDAMGSLVETQEAIATELRYQSLLDLGHETYHAICHLPLAKDLVPHARQQLVNRLDDHCEKHPLLFQKVIDIITAEIMPILRESGMSGQVTYFSDLRIFNNYQRAAQMLIDVLTDRGFKVSHTSEVTHVPVHVDVATGLIKNRKEIRHRFFISWDCRSVGDWQALEIAGRVAESTAKEPRISQSFIPPAQPPAQLTEGRKNCDTNTISSKEDAYLVFGS